MKHNRIVSIVAIASIVVLWFMLFFTSPTEIGPFGVLLFFTTLYAAIFSAFSLILQLFYKTALTRTTFRGKDYLYSAIMAFGPIMVLMARSFGAINIWTVGLIILFLFLAEFLVAKRV